MNWVWLKFFMQVYTSLMHLHTKNQRYVHHGFWEKCKLVVGDYGHFLENHTLDWDGNQQDCLSQYYPLPVQKSWKSNLPIAIYVYFNFCTFVDENVLQLNFLNQYFTKYKLGWAEILQESNYHSNASPHQKLEKTTSQISWKMQIGCRWWWSFSWKPCIGLRWNLPHFLFLPWC